MNHNEDMECNDSVRVVTDFIYNIPSICAAGEDGHIFSLMEKI